MLNSRERTKAIRHAQQRGMDLEDYLDNKHKDQAASRGLTVHEYLREQQDNRRQKYGVDGKTKQCRVGEPSDSSDDSADSGDEPLETRTDRGLSDFLGPMIDGVAKGLKDVLNI